jgi:hypothetical protein
MKSTVKSTQLVVPLSQNTAPVYKFDCLYTHDLVRKQKRWQDGVLAFHTFNKRIMVYDLSNNFIGDTHSRDSDSVNAGDELRLDRGILVEVGEGKGQRDQDITEVVAKKSGPGRNQNSPLRSTVSTGQVVRKPKSITAVLAGGRGTIGRFNNARVSSSLSNWSSPIEIDSPRPSKRPRIEEDTLTRPVLAAKPAVNNQMMPPTIRSGSSAVKVPSKTKRNTEQEEVASIGTIKAKEVSAKHAGDRKKKTRLSDQTLELPDASISRLPKPRGTTKDKTVKSSEDRTIASNDIAGQYKYDKKAKAPEPSYDFSMPAKDTTRPSNMLIGSKIRRKRLIFHSMATQNTSQDASLGVDRKRLKSGPRISSPTTNVSNLVSVPRQAESAQHETIPVSSSELPITGNISSDENDDSDLVSSYVPSRRRIRQSRTFRASVSERGRDGSRDSSNKPTTSESAPNVAAFESPLVSRLTHAESADSSRISGLLGDETILAAYEDSPFKIPMKPKDVRVQSVQAPIVIEDEDEAQLFEDDLDGLDEVLSGPAEPAQHTTKLAKTALEDSIPPTPPRPPSPEADLGSSPILVPASPPIASRRTMSLPSVPSQPNHNSTQAELLHVPSLVLSCYII